MSDEEKKAIELLKDFKRELNNIESYERADVEGKYKKILIVLQEDDFDTFQTILNLIEKQQKEIERIKSLDIYKLTEEWETGQLIHKDKIREKLNYFEHSYDYDDNGESYELVMKVLQELLEEK